MFKNQPLIQVQFFQVYDCQIRGKFRWYPGVNLTLKPILSHDGYWIVHRYPRNVGFKWCLSLTAIRIWYYSLVILRGILDKRCFHVNYFFFFFFFWFSCIGTGIVEESSNWKIYTPLTCSPHCWHRRSNCFLIFSKSMSCGTQLKVWRKISGTWQHL